MAFSPARSRAIVRALLDNELTRQLRRNHFQHGQDSFWKIAISQAGAGLYGKFDDG